MAETGPEQVARDLATARLRREEVGIGRWVGTDRHDPAAVGPLDLDPAVTIAPGPRPVPVLLTILVTAGDGGVGLLGATVILPPEEVVDLTTRRRDHAAGELAHGDEHPCRLSGGPGEQP